MKPDLRTGAEPERLARVLVVSWMELVWLVAFAAFGVLLVALRRARRLNRASQVRWLSVAGFVLFAVFVEVVAIDILVSPDHGGAATPADARATGIFFIVGGLVMAGFAVLVAVRQRPGKK